MSIDDIRNKIDDIDKQILELINERYENVLKIGELKQSKSQEIYVPEREKILLRRLEKLNNGPLPNKTLKAIFREIISGAISLEHPLQVGYSGGKTSIGHYASIAKFGHNIKSISYKNIESIFSDIANQRLDYGIVPIENSSTGVFTKSLDLFLNYEVSICSEINIASPINLYSKAVSIQDIETIYGDEVIFTQCSTWLKENLPNVKKIYTSFPESYINILNKDKKSALISNFHLEYCYNLTPLAKSIENFSSVTRFFIIGKQTTSPTGEDKTSICYTVDNNSGSLCKTLEPFNKYNFQATMLETRPSFKKNWRYIFFIDYLAHYEDPNFREALEQLNKICSGLKILGSYPKSEEIL